MEYEKDNLVVDENMISQGNLSEFLEQISLLDTKEDVSTALKSGYKSMEEKMQSVSMGSIFGWVVMGYFGQSFNNNSIFLGFHASAIIGVFFLAVLIAVTEYKDSKSLIYKFFKKTKTLVASQEKEENYHKTIKLESIKLENKKLQLEVLDYFKNLKANIEAKSQPLYESQYLTLMQQLSVQDYIGSIESLQKLLALVEKNKGTGKQVTYYDNLKQELNPQADIKKLL